MSGERPTGWFILAIALVALRLSSRVPAFDALFGPHTHLGPAFGWFNVAIPALACASMYFDAVARARPAGFRIAWAILTVIAAAFFVFQVVERRGA